MTEALGVIGGALVVAVFVACFWIPFTLWALTGEWRSRWWRA
jgi:hypothetical protein